MLFPIYDFPEFATFNERLVEIRNLIGRTGETVVSKAERVHWDGSRDPIEEEEYIRISRDEVPSRFLLIIRLTVAFKTDGSEYKVFEDQIH